MRNLIINKSWQYHVGKENVKIVGPDGQSCVVGCHVLVGNDPDVFNKENRNGSVYGMVTPKLLRKYIEKTFVK